MTHVRQQIRESAATALSGQTNAGTRVFSSLVFPNESSDLPLIHVHCDTESSELDGMGGLLSRVMTLSVRAFSDASNESLIDNQLDDLAAQIEAQIGGSNFSSLAKQTVLTETAVERSDEGAKPTASITLDFAVLYHTNESDGEVAL